MLEEIKSTGELYAKFYNNEAAAKDYLIQHLWNGVPTCSNCKGTEYYNLKSEQQPYYCKKCRRNFSIRSGTIFAKSNLPLHKWLIAMWHVTTSTQSICGRELSKHIHISAKAAWAILHKIRAVLADNNDVKFHTTVEIDEVHIGAYKAKMSKQRLAKAAKGSGCVGKTPVFGIRETETGRLKYIVAKDVTSETIGSILDKYVSKDAVLVSDQYPSYTRPGRLQANHIVLNHSKDEYCKDGYTSNGLEGSFKHFRDKLRGVHKGRMSNWHLQRYADEYTYIKNKSREKKVAQEAWKKGKETKDFILIEPGNLLRSIGYKELIRHSLNPRHIGNTRL